MEIINLVIIGLWIIGWSAECKPLLILALVCGVLEVFFYTYQYFHAKHIHEKIDETEWLVKIMTVFCNVGIPIARLMQITAQI